MKLKKISGLNGIQTPWPCDAGEHLNQLSYQANKDFVIM